MKTNGEKNSYTVYTFRKYNLKVSYSLKYLMKLFLWNVDLKLLTKIYTRVNFTYLGLEGTSPIFIHRLQE